MISHYHDLSLQVYEIQKILAGKVVHIQKIYGTSKTLSFQLRLPGKTYHLVWGRGGRYEGIGLSEKAPVSGIRQRGKLIEYVRKNVSSAQLKGIFLDEKDRIITLKYDKGGEHHFSLFYHGRKTYMAHSYELKDGETKCFTSWAGKRESCEHLSLFDEVGRKEIARKDRGEGRLFPWGKTWSEEETQFERDEKRLIKKKSKKSERKMRFIEEDLRRVQNWKKIQDWVLSQGLEGNIFDGKKKLFGISFNLGHGKTFFQKRDILFQKIKNLKKAEVFLEKRLERVKKENKTFQGHVPEIGHFKIEWAREKINSEKNKGKNKKANEDFLSFHYNGVRFLQGLSAQGNDEVRKHASKNFWWFHDGQGVSSHVIALSESLSDEIIAYGAFLILSQERKKRLDLQEIDLVYTQIKYLKSVKGQAGKVLYKKEKRRRFYLDELKKIIDDK